MAAPRVWTSIGLLAALALGCQPTKEEPDDQPAAPIAAEDAAEAFARQICASTFECACPDAANFVSEEQCVAQLQAEYQPAIDQLFADGGTWNAECAGALVDSWTDWACLGPAGAADVSDFDPRACQIVKGNQSAGTEFCSRNLLGDSCAEGLYCVAEVCVAVQVPAAIGQSCEVDWDELPCESGSYCAYDNASSGRICKSLPELGDSCNPNEDSVCGPSSLDLVCDTASSTCILAPDVGEPCYQGFLCGPGNYCDGGQDFTCQAKFDLGDGCGADSVCPVDASCIASFCAADPPAACNLSSLNLL